jgi:hypothetical protein
MSVLGTAGKSLLLSHPPFSPLVQERGGEERTRRVPKTFEEPDAPLLSHAVKPAPRPSPFRRGGTGLDIGRGPPRDPTWWTRAATDARSDIVVWPTLVAYLSGDVRTIQEMEGLTSPEGDVGRLLNACRVAGAWRCGCRRVGWLVCS